MLCPWNMLFTFGEGRGRFTRGWGRDSMVGYGSFGRGGIFLRGGRNVERRKADGKIRLVIHRCPDSGGRHRAKAAWESHPLPPRAPWNKVNKA